MRPIVALLFATGVTLPSALPAGQAEVAALPAPLIELRIDAPDLVGPWKMVVTNQGDVPVRFAADGRLLSLDIQPKEDPDAEASPKKRKAPRPITCKLPDALRPSGVLDDRAVILGARARYEEVVSPSLYCFSEAGTKALVEGATVTARLGFPDAGAKARKNAPPRPPLVVEPAQKVPTVAGLKELVAPSFVLPAMPTLAASTVAPSAQETNDPNGPKIELSAPARIDTPNERTVAMTLTVRNSGRRSAVLHIRRDNLMFDLDGPGGSAHCGFPAIKRGVPKELFTTLGAGASRTIDVWIGEMCPDVVFDRPGLYRLRASLAFPNSGEAYSFKAWTQTVTSKEPILVRVREGRLPFYPSPPQVFGGAH